MWYTTRHESTHFYSTIHPGRTTAGPGGITFVRCLCVAPLPDPARLCSWRTSPGDRPPTRLRRPDRAQRDPLVQRFWTGCPAGGVFAPPSTANSFYRARSRTAQRPTAPQSARFWPGAQHLDLGTGRPGEFRARDHRHPSFRRKCATSPQTLENQLEARQTLDHQPRSPLPTKKNARDRLIAWASTQTNWAIGFLDEVWWSRFALPRLHAWQDADHPVHLMEQSWTKGDPDPKALACYGVLWQRGPADEPIRDQMSLRFVTGRPVSDITTQFLQWGCDQLQAPGKTAWLLIGDNASWHVSKLVRTWIRDHNAQVKAESKGVRILACFLLSSWLSACVPILAVPLNLLLSFPKRSREYALGRGKTTGYSIIRPKR